MLYKLLIILLPISLLSGATAADKNKFSPYLAKTSNSLAQTSNLTIQPESAANVSVPQYQFKQQLLVIKKSRKKYKRTAQLQLFNMWIDPDITRLFIPRLKDVDKLSLNLHYSLKRSPYLLFAYDRVTVKTKVKSNGMLQHEAYYNTDIEGAVIGVKVRGSDPLLYFKYRFK